MQRVSPVFVLAALAAILSLIFLPGCGGSNTNPASIVAKIALVPSVISLNEGGVVTLSAIAENAAGSSVAADITFSSNNTKIATVSSGGLVCGGVWDANIVNCNATVGTGGVGQATITATSGNVSATATVYVHETVDSVQTVLTSNCTTLGQVVGVYGKAYSTSAPGCSPSAPCDITTTVGPFTFGSNDASIVKPSNSGATGLTAVTPGATTVFASVAGVNSVGVNYLTCPASTIYVHSSSNSDTTFNLNPQGTQALTADVYDINGVYIQPPLTWGSSSTAVATVVAGTSGANPGTVTAVTGGTAYITASCSFPNCNKYVPAQYSQNVVTVKVSGSSTVAAYVASTNSTSLVPITSSGTVGTAITLPNTPNSIAVDPGGLAVYLGSSNGLMAIGFGSTTVSTFPVNGTIIAITPDGKYMLLSDSAANVVNYFSISTGKLATSTSGTTASSAYTPDSSFNEWVNGTTLGAGLPTGLLSSITLPITANALDIMAQGGLTYVTSNQQIDVLSTCNQAQNQTLTATAPTLIKALPNGSGAVAVDSPNIDVISTPGVLNPGCPITMQSTINSYNLNAGSFTAQQLFISSDSAHVWIVPNLPEVLSFYVPNLTPATIPLAGGATPYNGGVTSDGTNVYVGTTDNTVHRIATASLTDVAQYAVNLKDAAGNPTAPNLVAVLP
jgi:hypothetical protein